MELYFCRITGEGVGDGEKEQWIRFPKKEETEFGLGRSIDHNVRLLSTHVSRNHALMKKSSEGSFQIRDQGSLNGIHVNETQIDPGTWYSLVAGDKIEIGRPDDESILTTMDIDDRFLYIVREAKTKHLDEKLPGPKVHMSASTREEMMKAKSKKKIFPKRSSKISTIAQSIAPQHQPASAELENVEEKSTRKQDCVVKDKEGKPVSLPEDAGIKRESKRVKFETPQDNEMERENKRLKLELEKEQALKEEIDARKLKLEEEKKKLLQELKDNKMERENKQLKLELEKKEQALKEEMDARKLKLEEEQKKTVEELEDDNVMERENKRLKQELEKKEQALKEEMDARKLKLEEEQKKIAEKLEEKFKNKLEQKEEELEIRLQLEKDIAVEQCKANLEKKESGSAVMDTVVDAMDNELQCSVCSELFIVSTTLNCAHTFCEYCINEWKKVKSICPVCRQPIATMTRSLVLDNYIDKVMESLPNDRRENRAKLIAERNNLKEAERIASTSGRGRGRGRRGRGSRRGGNNRGRGRGNRGRGRGSYNFNTYNLPVYIPNNIPVTHAPAPEPAAVVVISDNEDSDDSDSSDDYPYRYGHRRRYDFYDSDDSYDGYDYMY